MIVIDLISPQLNDTNVSPTTEVIFRVYDDSNTPIDTTNVNVYQVYPNSIPAILAGVFVNGWSGEIIKNAAWDYTIVVIPPTSTPDYGSGTRAHFTLEYEEL